MNNVLLTGANGFVGSNLAEALVARGDRVTCLVRDAARAERLQPLDVEVAHWRGLDDLDGLRRAAAGRDVVYHVAGATKAVGHAAFFRVNEQGTQNVARACAEQANPPVLVYVSSLAAAGPSSADRPRVETDPPRPVSHYGHSKRAAELALRRHADRVPITIVRPPIILGPADREGLAMFRPVRRFRVHVMPGSGRQRYSLVHVGDLCSLLILAAERGQRIGMEETDADARAKGCYFAACREYPTYAELGRLLRDAVGRRVVLTVPVPMAGAWTVAAVVETLSRVIRRPLYLNLDKAREIAAGSWTCSPQAAIDQLGFAPDVSLAQRLRETVAWYRESGWL
ncbi:MAG: NAD-dependent epimerase/dehydratase family protein [Planctomycetia bacterium]|nr:NAD-dependent epimerase/dehydratase family protein [Planctomycetia bacterium]